MMMRTIPMSLVLLMPLVGCDAEPDAADATVADAARDSVPDGDLPDGDLSGDVGPPVDAEPDADAPDPLGSADLLGFSRTRLMAAATALDPVDGFPKFVDDAGWTLSTGNVWTSGFFAGALWELQAWQADDAVRTQARRWTAPLEPQSLNRFNHDVGFKIVPTFGMAWLEEGEPRDRGVLITGAESLASRFDPDVGCTRSWSHGDWRFPVIIDNMMNLELLLWAARLDDRPEWHDMAVAHADKTAAEHIRPDGSSYHLVDYDPDTGEVLGRMTHQGAADASTWARGQAWAIYGFVMVHRFTGEQRHLDVARRTADHYLMRAGDDPVPFWDFDAPDIPDAPRDASAAAITASALLELSAVVEAPDDARYLVAAESILQALSADPYLTRETDVPSVLRQSVGHYPNGDEVSVPLIYADYYYVEALARYRDRIRGRPLTLRR